MSTNTLADTEIVRDGELTKELPPDNLNEKPHKHESVFEGVEDSPIEEVRAAVPPTDNPELPTNTFRAWFLGIFFTVILSFTNQFFWFRDNPLTIKILVAQLISFFFGKFMAKILPAVTIPIPFTSKGINLNPGPFNVKEHVLITVMANTAATSFDAIDIIVIQKLYYNVDWGYLGGLLLVLSSQTIGYGFAGLLQRFLVRPATMVWPENLVNASLFHTMHRQRDAESRVSSRGRSRGNYFLLVFMVSFIYYWFPGYIAPILTSISWLCWVKKDSIVVSQLGSGLSGLGYGAFTLDWSTMGAWMPSPLAVPWYIIANLFAGFLFFIWILVPAVYYTDAFEAKKFPMYNTRQYDIYGSKFNLSRVIENNVLNSTAYEEYSPIRITAFFAICYGQGLAALGAIIAHTALYHGQDIYKRLRSAKQADDDIHAKLMDRYPEIPGFWYLIIFVIALILSIVTITAYPSDMPWWTLFIALILAGAWMIPTGILTAITAQAPSISMITEWVFGVIRPGHPIGNIMFKTYGYITVKQALLFSKDMKLGHYMKIPPRDMFNFQIVGTVIGCLVSLSTTHYLLNNIDNICTDEAYPWTCPNAGLFGASSVVWGVVGPNRFFEPGTLYNPIAWFFLAGFLLPLPVWLAYKRWPNSWLKYVNVSAMMLGAGPYPPAPTNVLPTWTVIGFIFNFYIKRRHNRWWVKYNYITSAALDAGVAVCAVVMFFALQNNDVHFPAWWGNDKASIDQCPLAKVNSTGINVYG
ncbi:OPT family small oligopeptide transporter [Spizellomyces punctatus DAOM BR117]|uniref:OPT family small oligopeptide transporter n=1 Tax=Spizellomyces punctatus (strain DAOM BR117) TaxID=645134 RepID=A0A0L0H825_SPIPD|nr:OPT family small oligopeptide transporter [Spizellomyces punctatus DAOM BR117]KNC97084.1 OPT family small oligopeptide transporter [Spizellomyces punctatus DAOM BR117]|eukprot:XP_016605124.1 OPT family small oligopeptide transporter [Spizellomyces punctatus DAOM BR117]